MVIKDSATAIVAITRLIRAVDDPMLRTVVLGRAGDHPPGPARHYVASEDRPQRVAEATGLNRGPSRNQSEDGDGMAVRAGEVGGVPRGRQRLAWMPNSHVSVGYPPLLFIALYG